jgi:hypothetical protein
MWADTLLALERGHVVRLLVWGSLSLATGLAVLGVLRFRRAESPVLRHFSLQSLIWGAAELTLATFLFTSLALRDLSRATRFANVLWLELGLAAGVVAVGATLAIAGWTLARREGAVGAGLAIMVQGLALLLLHGRTLDALSRWM